MKNYIASLSKRALLLNGALAIPTVRDNGDLGDIYKGNLSGEYASDMNWIDTADKSTGTHVKYFYKNTSGWDTFCRNIYWEKSNTPETGEPASAGGSGGWSQGHTLDIMIDAYIRHTNNPEYQAHLYENIMKPFLPVFDDRNEYCDYGGKNFWNNFYDDMEWMVLFCLRIYELTGDQDYYNALTKMWNRIKGAKNGYKGVGGMAWRTDVPASCMSCSNGPGCLLAMKLYQLTIKEAKDGWEEQAAYYLNFAREAYNWMMACLCDVSTGQVYDNLSTRDGGTPGDPNKVVLSYNQETSMAVALELYNATSEDEYPRNTVVFDSYQVNKKVDPSYLIFSGEGNLGGNFLFCGIFIRYFLDMVKRSISNLYPGKTKNKFIAALRNCSDVLRTLAHPGSYYVREYDWVKASTLGNRDSREDHLMVFLNVEIPGATMIETRICYEDRAQGRAVEKASWVEPNLGRKTEE